MLGGVSSPLLFTCSATQLLKHFPLAEIVLFHQHTESSLGPGLFRGFQRVAAREGGEVEGLESTACTMEEGLIGQTCRFG